MSKLITISELKELREKIKSEKATDKDYMRIFQVFSEDESKKDEKPTQLVKVPTQNVNNGKAGFSNIIYLATLSLVSEICFLALSFIIYK